MENKVRKIDRQTRKKYERRAKRRNRRHPIEHVIELGFLAIILIVVVSVTMHNCSKPNNSQQDESTTEHTMNEEESSSYEETEEQTKENETSKQEIPTTSSVWEDAFETVDSWINNFEKDTMKWVIDEWEADRMFFNLTMGSLDMLQGIEGITQLTEEMNMLQKRLLMSNVVIEPDNVISIGRFDEKYMSYQNLITTMKENLRSGVSVSRRYVSNDYIGYEAPLQNALGLVPTNYEEMADNLKHMGITLNIIPEHIKPEEDWDEYVEILHEYGIATGIHFPYDGMEYSTMEELIAVYQPIFDAGIDYIVMSEKVFPFMTGNEPATFSKRFMQLIRSTFKFEGVIVTADMSSNEIKEYIDEQKIEQPEIYAFIQGCDMVYTSNNYEIMYGQLNLQYTKGNISDAKLRNSMERVIKIAYLYEDLYVYED